MVADIRQRAVLLIDQLPQSKLEAVVQLLEVLTEPAAGATREESHLLATIQRRLPEPEQTRLDGLRTRCEWGELSESEHQELIGFEDRLEQYRVERLEALIALAQLKDLDLPMLNQQFSPSSSAA
ncbi:MAG: hypothetical protein WBA10_03105 [Elainellaceae cyanobacterium]